MTKTTDRYFIVFFHGIYGEERFNGNTDIISEDGYYLNKRACMFAIDEQYGFDEVIITGWKELTEEEYLNWKE